MNQSVTLGVTPGGFRLIPAPMISSKLLILLVPPHGLEPRTY